MTKRIVPPGDITLLRDDGKTDSQKRKDRYRAEKDLADDFHIEAGKWHCAPERFALYKSREVEMAVANMRLFGRRLYEDGHVPLLHSHQTVAEAKATLGWT
jgi:hypothetical protein